MLEAGLVVLRLWQLAAGVPKPAATQGDQQTRRPTAGLAGNTARPPGAAEWQRPPGAHRRRFSVRQREPADRSWSQRPVSAGSGAVILLVVLSGRSPPIRRTEQQDRHQHGRHQCPHHAHRHQLTRRLLAADPERRPGDQHDRRRCLDHREYRQPQGQPRAATKRGIQQRADQNPQRDRFHGHHKPDHDPRPVHRHSLSRHSAAQSRRTSEPVLGAPVTAISAIPAARG